MERATDTRLEEVTTSNCEQEQIHIPGLIQSFGILLCVDATDLRIAQISENVEQLLGRSSHSLLGKSLSDLIAVKNFEALQSKLLLDADEKYFRLPVEVKKSDGVIEPWMSFIHQQDRNLIIELERTVEKQTPSFSGDLGFLSTVEKSISEIQAAPSVKELCEITTREIQRITNYDRVMIYAFDPAWNGEVLAEARSGTGIDSYLGHRFPASDIPSQARAVFLSNWVRMIPDVNYVPVPIVPTLHPKTRASLDLGQSFLRAVSPIHIQYLKNMKVGASLTISLIKDGRLWGLIACHHTTAKLLTYDVRSACKFVGKLVSSQLGFKVKVEGIDEGKRLGQVLASLRKSMNKEEDLVRGLVNYSPSLRDLISSKDASAAIRIEGEWMLVGKTPGPTQLNQLADWLSLELEKSDAAVFHTDCLSEQFSEAESYKDVASGIIAVAIPKAIGSFIIWFKAEVVQTVTWAGNPKKSVEKLPDGTLKIEPRSSFEGWKETVVARSLPWDDAQIDAAIELKNLIIAIDLGRQFRKEQEARTEAEKISREKGDFLATVSHDLKNPLSSIELLVQWFERKHQQAEQSEVLADVTSAHSKIKVATRRMLRLIEDLLDVAKIEGGTFSLDLKMKDVSGLVAEAVYQNQPMAQDRGVTLEVSPVSDVCSLLLDEDRMMQVLSNLMSNALKFTPRCGKIVVSFEDLGEEVRISVQDSGAGISPDHLPHVFDRFWQAHETRRKGTGLGLTICKGIVEAFGGRIWIDSKVGQGTTVSFTVPKHEVAL